MRSLRDIWRELWPNDRVLGINRRNLDYVFADYRPGKFAELDDKLLAKSKCEKNGVAVPRTIGVLRTQLELDELSRWLSENDELVLKPAKGWGGRGILVLERDGDGFATPGGTHWSMDAIQDHARETMAGNFSLDESDDCVLVEERVHSHAFLRELYSDGLSDLRIVLEHGKPLQAMLRVPTRESDGKANLHSGGLGLGIDIETGRVTNAIQHDAPVAHHPDSHAELVGLRVPLWDECRSVATRAAALYEHLDYIGVDIVLDEARGPLLLEVNARPGLAIQLANRTAQPVASRATSSPLQYWTFVFTWLVFAALAVGPFLLHDWIATGNEEQQRVLVTAISDRGQNRVGSPSEDRGSVEWSEASSDISAENAEFARARVLADSGDHDGAIVAYTAAAADSSIAPFAWNNIGLLHREAGELDLAEEALLRALRSHPEYPRGNYNLGLVHRDKGKLTAAEDDFRRALAQRPSYGRAWGELGKLLVERGAGDEALRALGQAIRYEPTLASYRKVLGEAQLRQGRFAAAAGAYHEALALDADSRVAAEGWVRALLQRAVEEDWHPSEGTLDSMERLTERFDAKDQSDSRRLLAARVRWWAKGPAAARSIAKDLDRSALPQARRLSEANALAMGTWTALQNNRLTADRSGREAARLGRALQSSASKRELLEALAENPLTDPRLALLPLRAQGVNAARADLDRAFAACASSAERRWVEQMGSTEAALVSPDSLRSIALPLLLERTDTQAPLPLPSSYLIWSTARIARLEGIDDSPWFQSLLEIGKDFRPAMRRNFDAAVSKGDATLARDIGLQFLSDAGDPTEILLPLIRLELDRGREAAARSLFERLDRAAQRSPDAQILYAEILLQEKKPKNATKRLDAVLQQSPSNVEALYLKGRALAARRKRTDARQSFALALDQAPERADIRSALARVLMDERNYDAAVSEWRRVLALGPDGATQRSALFNLPLSEQRAGSLEAAISDWGRFLLIDPGDSGNYRAHYNLALAQEALGRRDDAVASLEKVLQMKPDHAASQERLARLRSKGNSP